MKTPEEIFDEAIKAKGLDTVSVKDADLYEAGLDAIKQALSIPVIVQRTLEQKIAEEKEICEWFENEYSPAITDEDEVKEWDKKGIEVNAQIKLLRFMMANWE